MNSTKLSEEQVASVLSIEEGHLHDLKAIEIKPSKLTETVSAFANASGGEIYVGIDEIDAAANNIMEKPKEILEFWEEFKNSDKSQKNKNEDFEIDDYGDSPEMRNELLGLILEGKKTATCGSLFQFEHEGYATSQVGDKRVVVDGSGAPACITEIVEVTIQKFKEVKEDFARDEGEGDGSLEYWRKAHWEFFSRVLPPIGGEVSEDMMVICERFKVIYRSNANKTCEGTV